MKIKHASSAQTDNYQCKRQITRNYGTCEKKSTICETGCNETTFQQELGPRNLHTEKTDRKKMKEEK